MNLLRFATGSFKEAPTVRDVDVSLLVFDGIFRNISMVPPSLFEKRTNNGLFNWIVNFPVHLWHKKIFSRCPTSKLCLTNVKTFIEIWIKMMNLLLLQKLFEKETNILKLLWNTLMVLIYSQIIWFQNKKNDMQRYGLKFIY